MTTNNKTVDTMGLLGWHELGEELNEVLFLQLQCLVWLEEASSQLKFCLCGADVSSFLPIWTHLKIGMKKENSSKIQAIYYLFIFETTSFFHISLLSMYFNIFNQNILYLSILFFKFGQTNTWGRKLLQLFLLHSLHSLFFPLCFQKNK